LYPNFIPRDLHNCTRQYLNRWSKRGYSMGNAAKNDRSALD
jgi:hypothetical protein